MICEVDADWLWQRGHWIADMLVPLTGPRKVAFESQSVRGDIFIYVYSGPRPISAPRDWRFRTVVGSVRGSYFERWLSSDEKRRRYHLDRAYLHLYAKPQAGETEDEILALHCDPNEPDDAGELKHAIYKRGPHIHVVASDPPLPHSHFALNAAHLREVLRSAEALGEAMRSGVALVRDQVLDIIDAQI